RERNKRKEERENITQPLPSASEHRRLVVDGVFSRGLDNLEAKTMTDQTLVRVVLASRPEGAPISENFRVEKAAVPTPADGEVLLKVRYLSLDPYMRGRMSAAKSYAAPVEIGAVMEGGTVAEVIDSRHPEFAVGDIVLSHSGWQTHALSNGVGLKKLDPAA